MDYKDYYNTLGVSKNADKKEITHAFRELARKYHPDKNKGDDTAEEKFKEINEAYQVLSDPDKRSKYDRFGSDYQKYARTGGNPNDFDWGRYASGQGGARTVSPEEFERIFGGMGGAGGGGFSDFFETLFGGLGGARTRQQAAPRRRNVEQNVEITLDEAYRGTTRVLQKTDGTRGEVTIPKGVKTGSRVRVAGGGGQGVDLYLKVTVAPHLQFKRKGDNLHVDVPVDLFTLILGGEIEVPTLERPLLLTVPANTENGKTFRLRGKGMAHMKSPDTRGDLLATVVVILPKNLSDEEKGLYEKLRSLRK